MGAQHGFARHKSDRASEPPHEVQADTPSTDHCIVDLEGCFASHLNDNNSKKSRWEKLSERDFGRETDNQPSFENFSIGLGEAGIAASYGHRQWSDRNCARGREDRL